MFTGGFLVPVICITELCASLWKILHVKDQLEDDVKRMKAQHRNTSAYREEKYVTK